MKNKENKLSRRVFFEMLGKGSVVLALLAEAVGAIKAFIPKVLYEPPSQFKIGKPSEFAEGITFLSERKLFIIRRGKSFHAISAVCTHLNCVVDWKADHKEFYCSCHGSTFSQEGINLTGPAPKPLPWFSLALAPDGNLVVDSAKTVSRDFEFLA